MTSKRSDIPKKDTWDISTIWKSNSEWNDEVADLEKESNNGWNSVPILESFVSADELAGFLEKYFILCRRLEKICVYAHLLFDSDTTNDESRRMSQKSETLNRKFITDFSWFVPTLLKADEKILDECQNAFPMFSTYIEKNTRMRDFILDLKVEKCLKHASQALSTPNAAYKSLTNSDMEFCPVKDSKGNNFKLTSSTYSKLIQSQDRSLRREAFTSLHCGFKSVKYTITELLRGMIEKAHLYSSIRGFSSSLHASLYHNQVDESVYHSLIKAVRSKLIEHHRYIELRKKVLKLETIHAYDMYAPLFNDERQDIPFDKAIECVVESIKPLGKEYQSKLQNGLVKERWVDVKENVGKRGGAYSSGGYDTNPFILLNYKGTIRDVFTLSHEAGHSMHSLYSKQNQSYQDASYSIFVAEVASTLHEECTFHYLYKKADSSKERIILLTQKLDDIRATLFRQTMFAEFELYMHNIVQEKEAFDVTTLKKKYLELNREYFGRELELDDELGYEFLRIPHFYMNFYVYQYATGIAAAYSLAKRILQEDSQSIENYLTFISSGSIADPITLLKRAGVDMQTITPVDELISYFSDLRALLEKEVENS